MAVRRLVSGLCATWFAGGAWIFRPHRFQGGVLFGVGSWGVHVTDPLGVVVPAVLTVLVFKRLGAVDQEA
jgi:hypothetical protein